MINKLANKFTFTVSKKAWFKDHINDSYVKMAKMNNYRSRASFKLKEIQSRYHILGQKILDLGAAPGGWSQIAKQLKPNSQVIAVDLLKMQPLQGVTFYQTDANNKLLHDKLKQQIGEFNSIISDMAPNFTDSNIENHESMIQLNRTCLKLSIILGSNKCNLVMKTLPGQYDKIFQKILQNIFDEICIFKPQSSKSRSTQFFLICKHRKQIPKQLHEKIQKLQFTPTLTTKYIKQYLNMI